VFTDSTTITRFTQVGFLVKALIHFFFSFFYILQYIINAKTMFQHILCIFSWLTEQSKDYLIYPSADQTINDKNPLHGCFKNTPITRVFYYRQ
jgi:hypothetical protein